MNATLKRLVLSRLLLCIGATFCFSGAGLQADTIIWLNVSDTNGEIVFHPEFGNVQVDWTISNATTVVSNFDNGAGALGNLSWHNSNRLNFIDPNDDFTATATFSFLDGPAASNAIYLNVTGLGNLNSSFSSMTLDKNVTFLGTWLTVDGPSTQTPGAGTHTWDASSIMGFNTDGELHTISGGLVNSLEFELSGLVGDGFGMNIGAVLLGDVNLDGVVNLLDVDPFIDRIASGTFQAEADCNLDGVVNLLDVDAFIVILSGG